MISFILDLNGQFIIFDFIIYNFNYIKRHKLTDRSVIRYIVDCYLSIQKRSRANLECCGMNNQFPSENGHFQIGN